MVVAAAVECSLERTTDCNPEDEGESEVDKVAGAGIEELDAPPCSDCDDETEEEGPHCRYIKGR